jgi:hypothetical protein
MIHSREQARKLVLALILVELLLVVVYGTDAWIQTVAEPVHPVIDLDAEANLPTWFSSFQLVMIAISSWTLAAYARPTQRPSRRFLRLCGGFFLYLSADETAMFHERITASLGSRYVDWLPAYLGSHLVETFICVLVLVACAACAYPHLRGLWRLSSSASMIGIAGCAVFVTGAAVLETIGYKMLQLGVAQSVYRVEVAAEEFLEMLGASLILYAVLLFNVLRTQATRRIASGAAARRREQTNSTLRPRELVDQRKSK